MSDPVSDDLSTDDLHHEDCCHWLEVAWCTCGLLDEIERLRAERVKWLALERAVRSMKVYPGLAVDLAIQEVPDE